MSYRAPTPSCPLDDGLRAIREPESGLLFPPVGWRVIQPWGDGWALQHPNGLRLLVDCAAKSDGYLWVHVSVSRKNWTPSHADMAQVKLEFFGDRYAYSVWPPSEKYVNIHQHCLHLWGRVDGINGQILPEFSAMVDGVKSI